MNFNSTEKGETNNFQSRLNSSKSTNWTQNPQMTAESLMIACHGQ